MNANSMFVDYLQRNIHYGTLYLTLPDGQEHCFGEGEPVADWHILDGSVIKRIYRDPDMELGNTYMEGLWSAGANGLRSLIHVLMGNFPQNRPHGLLAKSKDWLKRLLKAGNRIATSYRNVEHHYDLDEWLFRNILDENMLYSCAYFAEPGMSLEQAQMAKCEHIKRKLVLEPGMRVLEIGCGWGGLGAYLAENAGVSVTGLTLSREQHRVASAMAEQKGISDRVEFKLEDYREHTGQYDRIVSVGMFEHVGPKHYREFFDQVSSLLNENGVALLHTIGCTKESISTNPWIERHIFPGGYIPSLAELAQGIEPADVFQTDIEVLSQHYAFTMAQWFKRFQKVRDQVKKKMGERFCRMWEFYLASTEHSFLFWDLVVYQVQLAKQHGIVPITRDYMYRDVPVPHSDRLIEQQENDKESVVVSAMRH